jgi:hypothetical protein
LIPVSNRTHLPRVARARLSAASATRCGTIGNMSDLITKLVPILHVEGPVASNLMPGPTGLSGPVTERY